MAAIFFAIFLVIWVTRARAESKREVFEFTNFSCKVDVLSLNKKKDCVDQLNLFGSDGWQLGAATVYDAVHVTFWLQRKKQ